MTLHPACFNSQNCYLFGVTRQDKLSVRKFKIIDGFSKPVKIEEEKPGMKTFDLTQNRDGTVTTFQVVKLRSDQQIRLSEPIGYENLDNSFDSFD